MVSFIRLGKISFLYNDVSATPNHRLLNTYIGCFSIIDPKSKILETGEAVYYCCHSMKFYVETQGYHESTHHYWGLYRQRRHNGKVPCHLYTRASSINIILNKVHMKVLRNPLFSNNESRTRSKHLNFKIPYDKSSVF